MPSVIFNHDDLYGDELDIVRTCAINVLQNLTRDDLNKLQQVSLFVCRFIMRAVDDLPLPRMEQWQCAEHEAGHMECYVTSPNGISWFRSLTLSTEVQYWCKHTVCLPLRLTDPDVYGSALIGSFSRLIMEVQTAPTGCFRTTRTIKLVAFYAILAPEFENLAKLARQVRRFQRDGDYCFDRYLFRHRTPGAEVAFDVGFQDAMAYRLRISFVSITIIGGQHSMPSRRRAQLPSETLADVLQLLQRCEVDSFRMVAKAWNETITLNDGRLPLHNIVYATVKFTDDLRRVEYSFVYGRQLKTNLATDTFCHTRRTSCAADDVDAGNEVLQRLRGAAVKEFAFEALSEDTADNMFLDAWMGAFNALLLERPSKIRRLIVRVRPSTLPFWKGKLARIAAESVLYLLPTAFSGLTVHADRILELLFDDERTVPLEVRLHELAEGNFVERILQAFDQRGASSTFAPVRVKLGYPHAESVTEEDKSRFVREDDAQRIDASSAHEWNFSAVLLDEPGEKILRTRFHASHAYRYVQALTYHRAEFHVASPTAPIIVRVARTDGTDIGTPHVWSAGWENDSLICFDVMEVFQESQQVFSLV